MKSLERLTLAYLWVAFTAFAVACIFGLWQMWARSPLPAPFHTPDNYFLSVSTTVVPFVSEADAVKWVEAHRAPEG